MIADSQFRNVSSRKHTPKKSFHAVSRYLVLLVCDCDHVYTLPAGKPNEQAIS